MSGSAEDFLAQHDDPRPKPLLEDGTVIDGWRVTSLIGRGGSGEVYRVVGRDDPNAPLAEYGIGRAARPAPPQAAALKLLARDTETARARFRRETELLAKMDNPAFPRFLAKGEIDGRPYVVTELLEPRTLPTSDCEVADFMLTLCGGVATLHRIGYIHRDIKPGNILWRTVGASVPLARGRASRASLPDAVPVLIDLGLAKDMTRASDAEGTSISIVDGRMVGVGTPGYAAPEQLVGNALSPAADIHALGVLANTCFGGHPPPMWGRIIDRATGSIPTRRYPNVVAFARAIRRRHWRRNMIGCAILLVIACAIAAIPLLRTKPPPPRPPTVSNTNPAKLEHPFSAIAERRQKLVRAINERLQALSEHAKKASDKMDEHAAEIDRLFKATNEVERAAISARIKILDSELAKYPPFYIATTNEVEKLKAELDSLSDSAADLQVTK